MRRSTKPTGKSSVSSISDRAGAILAGRLLDGYRDITSAPNRGTHDRYLDVLELVKKRKREDGGCVWTICDESTAFFRLLAIQSHDLLTDEEMEAFQRSRVARAGAGHVSSDGTYGLACSQEPFGS